MSNLSFLSTSTPFSSSLGYEVFYIRTLVDFCGYTILHAQHLQAQQNANNIELAAIEAQNRARHQEYLQSKENLESIKTLAHDLKHKIIALQTQIDPQQQNKEFERLQTTLQSLSSQEHTGNSILDVVLTTKHKTCIDNQINFSTVVDGSLLHFMTPTDIATLFGNAIDNAIEASAKVQNIEQRQLHLQVSQQKDFIVIACENYYTTPIRHDTQGAISTSKKDTSIHGYGIKSIKKIVQQYDGEVNINTNNNWFKLTIIIPNKNRSRD
ncbi:MAG: ATP-binding protein [Bifidobacteriaceae bacterium]|nr:ATP-binding protein [Bifidobacteriaceae bacterium]